MAVRAPRILVTGFGPFPGAPENPTQKLIEALDADPSLLGGLGEIRAAILAVEYDSAPSQLAALGADFAPDIAIHFGLSAKAEGFTLERLARNEIATNRPDNKGGQPQASCIVDGGEGLQSTLPLDATLPRRLPTQACRIHGPTMPAAICAIMSSTCRAARIFPASRRQSAALSMSRQWLDRASPTRTRSAWIN